MTSIQLEPNLAEGTVIRLDRQEYELRGSRPHTRKDGQTTTLLEWETHCPVCHQPFTVLTGATAASFNRRCQAHRRIGKPVHGKRGRKVRVAIDHP